MSKKLKPIIQKLKSYQPDKVILFGSYAWGKPDRDSDVDLLVIKNTKQNPYRRIPEVRKKLNDLDTLNIEPTRHPIEGLKNVFRKDELWEGLNNKEALGNSKHTKDGYFKAPKILKE